MKTLFRPTLLAAAVLSLSSIATAADLADGASRRVVRYGDLNLTRLAGVKVLYERISHSARDACEQVNSRSLAAVAKAQECTRQSIARAVAEVDAPLLSSYHSARIGRLTLVAQGGG